MENTESKYTPEFVGALFGEKREKPEFELVGEILKGSPLEDRLTTAADQLRKVGNLSHGQVIDELKRRGYSYQNIESLNLFLDNKDDRANALYSFYDFHLGEKGYYYLLRQRADYSLSLAVGEASLDNSYPINKNYHVGQPSMVIFSIEEVNLQNLQSE